MDYSEGSAASLETASDIEKDSKGVVKRWLLELKLADKRESDWRKMSEKILSKYRQKNAKKNSFNILWSNTETLRPAIYNSLPQPDVRRRFKDADPIGKAVSDVLSRSLEYMLDTTDFHASINATVLDMLLPGRGVCRVRYVPSIRPYTPSTATPEAEPVPNGEEKEDPDQGAMEGEAEELAWEQAPIEHVQYDDYRQSAGKEWGEVTWIGFKHTLTRDELTEQFGALGKKVNLDSVDDDEVKAERDEKVVDSFKTAVVWEIWDKDKTKVLFIAPGYKEAPLKELDDPLGLQDFWPVPRPLYAIPDASSMVPVPLYELYKEQAEELDQISTRINRLVKGLKMRGIYDSTLSELDELMRGEDNDLIPAQNVSALLERGGLEKAIWFLPIEQSAKVLKELYIQRDQIKQVIYEIIGLGDIMRGVSDPNETAAAQNIKSSWGKSRISGAQREVARFIRDLMRLQGELIAEKFQPETFKTMTGLKFPMLAEKQQAMMQFQQQQQMQAQQAMQQGQQPPPPAQPPQMPPAWEEVIQVLRDDAQRTFKVDIETDSTVAATLETDMQAMQQLLGGITQLVSGLGPAVQMGAMPVEALKEIILAVTRRAKLGNAVEDALDDIKAPNPQQGDPNAAKAQADMQMHQAQMQQDMQVKQMEMQQGEKFKQAELQAQAQLDQQKLQAESQMQAQQMQFDMAKAKLEAETKIIIAQITAEAGAKQAAMQAETAMATKPAEPKSDGTSEALAVAIQGFTAAIEQLRAPRTITRGPDGLAIGIQ